jgi:hypothetical protein
MAAAVAEIEIGDYGINDCLTRLFQGIFVESSGRRLVG